MRFDSRGHNRVPGPTFAHTGIDTAAVYAIADRFGAAAELIDGAVCDHLARLAFGGACAGRVHTARGDALHTRLDRLAAQSSQWSRAAAEIAVALRASAGRYGESELYAAARIA
jgi:hypothetical protein